MVLFLNNLLLALLTLSLFTGCSSKTSYTPEDGKMLDSKIPFIFTDTKIERVEHKRVKLSDGSILNSAGDSISISLETEKLLKNPIVYSQQDNLIAYVSEENVVAILDIDLNQTIFKEKFNKVSTIDRRLPKPLFDRGSILYFTLDGKIAIYSKKMKKIVRVVSVGDNEDYSNVIDYRLSKDSLILVTHRKLMMITDDYDDQLELNLRGSIFDKDKFFLITKDGEIREYDYNLVLKKSIKFPFAYFIAFGKVEEKIYLIESQGYVIELESDLESYKVLSSELDDENCFFTIDKFICDEKFFRLPLSL